MPNAKVGTLVIAAELANGIRREKAGQATFKVDKGKNIHVSIGKMSFTDEQLLINFK
jgi:large subunit ribosomal protein L1